MDRQSLTLVSNRQADNELTRARQVHELRAQWLDSLTPNRSRYRGSAGVEAMKRLRPLAPDEQACADRTSEKVARAREGDVFRGDIVAQFEALR